MSQACIEIFEVFDNLLSYFFSPPSPIFGLSVTADRLLGPTLLALTSEFHCLTLPLL